MHVKSSIKISPPKNPVYVTNILFNRNIPRWCSFFKTNEIYFIILRVKLNYVMRTLELYVYSIMKFILVTYFTLNIIYNSFWFYETVLINYLCALQWSQQYKSTGKPSLWSRWEESFFLAKNKLFLFLSSNL